MQEDKKPASAAEAPVKKEPKPWPMSWVIIAVLVYAVIQTAVMVYG